MNDDELSSLLRSPVLSLDPPTDLLTDVRARAGRVRRRRTAGTTALSVVALLVAVLAGPGLVRDLRDDVPEQVASGLATRFPAATSSVAVLERLNGGQVVTWFEDRAWCTAAVRSGTARGCSRALGTDVPPFAFVRTPGSETLTVDRSTLVAGVLGTGVQRVEVVLSDGSTPRVRQVSREGFVRPVWWAAVPPGATLRSATAHDAEGRVVGRL